ncbi:bifunctional oligoribonuclease/PAP phosphatase NrnA [bacterium]|nr:bifunctional oligoribonuclease/PAP phosphatase NrnA [bacterium]
MENFSKINEILADSKKIIIAGHVNPDPDCMGSSLAVYSILKSMGKEVTLFRSDKYPYNGAFLEYAGVATETVPDFEPDLYFILDSATPERTTEPFFTKMAASKSRKILFDHHRHKDNGFYDAEVTDEGASATAAIVYRWAKSLGHELTKGEAEDICFGIFGDTGGLRYASTDKEALSIVADLAEKINYGDFCSKFFENLPENWFAMFAEVLNSMEKYKDGKVVFFATTLDQLRRFNLAIDEIDPYVEEIRRIGTVKIIFRIREVEAGKVWKFSVRSRGDIDCIPIAQKFGGGGHKNAAGFTFYGTLDEGRKAVLEIAETLDL